MTFDIVIIDECGTEQVFANRDSLHEANKFAKKVRKDYVEFRSVWVEENSREVAYRQANEAWSRDEYDLY